MKTVDKIIKSIFAINPTAQFTFEEEDIDNIQWLNGTTPISKSDLEAKMLTIENEIAQTETDKANKKASGKQKLKDLGLDDDEVKALIGA
tara:strand:+ start:386 stop:655 length:270 start_codon:yes stop_codon:yes gene_type:complete